MSCCCGRQDDVVDGSRGPFRALQQPFLGDGQTDNDTSSAGASWLEEEKRGPTGDSYPVWQKDEKVLECYQCNTTFGTFTERKHHCRRCRNIFCGKCTDNRSAILLFSIEEEVRVCDNCFQELYQENIFIAQQKPLLMKGENFKKKTFFSTKVVHIRMTQDEKTLVYTADNKGEATSLPMDEIVDIKLTSLTAFELLLAEKKVYSFEAGSSGILKTWVEALKVAIERAKQPSLKERVDDHRRQQMEEKKRSEYQVVTDRLAQKRKAERTQKLDSIRGKYGFQ